ncbi:imidazoleglycerol-phosphate dehydratase HisB [Oscillospiraceae bacterium CM]|nr:imidazoleglycerol-phosphate dehydratase HisB [Oscillospiraceae bacterium CM]
MRQSDIQRKTAETDISLKLNLDGRGDSTVDTGIGFLDHMLTLFARHGRFDVTLTCQGDTHVDAHHTVEDIGLCLGMAFAEALGDMKGIKRYGDMLLPMDEALVLCAVDVSGRSCLAYGLDLPDGKVGSMDTELVEEFLLAFVRKAGITLHVRQLAGGNTHHIIEACFKALTRALAKAVSIDAAFKDEIPSTKGVI